jgi:hypothetical protein
MNLNLVTTKRITILYTYIMIRYPPLVSRISIVIKDSFSIDIAKPSYYPLEDLQKWLKKGQVEKGANT